MPRHLIKTLGKVGYTKPSSFLGPNPSDHLFHIGDIPSLTWDNYVKWSVPHLPVTAQWDQYMWVRLLYPRLHEAQRSSSPSIDHKQYDVAANKLVMDYNGIITFNIVWEYEYGHNRFRVDTKFATGQGTSTAMSICSWSLLLSESVTRNWSWWY